MISLESNVWFYLVVATFYLYAFVSCVNLAKSNEATENSKVGGVLTQEYTGLLKGILAINIILCHFAARAENLVLPFKMLGLLGGPSVAVFLCISGYAETYAMDHKGIQKYYEGYLIKKIFCQYTHVNVPPIFSNTTPPNHQQRCTTFTVGKNARWFNCQCGFRS